MDDKTAFERQVAEAVQEEGGPSLSVDAMAVTRVAKADRPRWRTQSMFSPAKAITAGALVFAIGGVLLIAQPFDQQGSTVPGAETDAEPAEMVEFTARFPWGGQIAGGSSERRPDGIVETIGWASRVRTIEASDSRFEGEMVQTCNWHEYQSPNANVFDCVFRIETAVGGWQSRNTPGLKFPGPGYGPFSVLTVVFDGEGAYEGHSAIVEIAEVKTRGFDMHGLVVESGVPPAAEPYASK